MKRLLLFLNALFLLSASAVAAAQTLREQLFIAIQNDDIAECRRLVRAGVHYTAKSPEGDTPLIAAAAHGNTDIFKLLLESGADVSARSTNGETALHLAALHEDATIARMLLERGLAVDAVNRDGETPLIWAALTPSLPVAQVLVKAGAKVTHADHSGNTPLHAAAAEGHADMVAFLLANRADRNARNKARERPIDLARESEADDVVRMLDSRRR